MNGNEELNLHGSEAKARALEQLCAYHDGELGGVERWLIGSVADRVFRHASSNVYVVR